MNYSHLRMRIFKFDKFRCLNLNLDLTWLRNLIFMHAVGAFGEMKLILEKRNHYINCKKVIFCCNKTIICFCDCFLWNKWKILIIIFVLWLFSTRQLENSKNNICFCNSILRIKLKIQKKIIFVSVIAFYEANFKTLKIIFVFHFEATLKPALLNASNFWLTYLYSDTF